MDVINTWGETIPCSVLLQEEIDYLLTLPKNIPDVQWLWAEMDRIWYAMGLDNSQPLNQQKIGDYYGHPIWIVNGLFTKLDTISQSHRLAIAQFLAKKQAKTVADYGGGFGEMAMTLAQAMPDADISIIEPYPSKLGLYRLENYPKIKQLKSLDSNRYDAIIAQDVLEHVEDPVLLAFQLADAVKMGGTVVFANCFFPYIQCHLPSTFHLRHTFPSVCKALGLKYSGVIKGAYHAQTYQKVGEPDLQRVRAAEMRSQKYGNLLNSRLATLISKVKRRVFLR